MHKPILYIFAGGNGAGKSTFSSLLTPEGTIIVNPDEIAKNSQTHQHANAYIGELKEQAIQNKKSILIETNFLFEDEIDSFLAFKEAGFEMHLFYFVLSSLKESELRVHLRKSKGGHYVDDYTRELNFTVGLENSIKHAKQFDTVRILANTIYFQKELLCIEHGNVRLANYKDSEWTTVVAERFKNAVVC